MPAPQGLFVTFEGPEGSGKSSQIQRLAEALGALGHAVCVTREPGGTSLGERVREVLLDPSGDDMRPDTEALLFCAARSELVARVVQPAMADGAVVLCDRFADATVAYQGYGGGADLGWLADLNRRVTRGLSPDLTVLLDLPPEVGLARRRGLEWTRLDAADLAFHERVRAGYLELAAAEPRRWIVIAADRPPDEVATDVHAAVAGLVRRRTATHKEEP